MPAGLFFVSIGLFQLIWARVVLVRTTRPVLAAGIMFNVGSVTMWALSRTAGAPFGPHAGEAELVQAADLCALLLQIYVVMGAGWVWYRGLQGEPIPGFASAVVLLGAVGVVALASVVGVASGLRHGHHPAGAAEPDHHGSVTAEHTDDHHGHHLETGPLPSVIEPVGTPATPPHVDVPTPPAQPLHNSHGDHDHGD
jgi:hypothetical protein